METSSPHPPASLISSTSFQGPCLSLLCSSPDSLLGSRYIPPEKPCRPCLEAHPSLLPSVRPPQPCSQPLGASAQTQCLPSKAGAGRESKESRGWSRTSAEPAAAKQAGSRGGHLPRRLGYVGRYLGCCNIHEGKIRYLNLFSNKCISVGEHSSC